MALKPLLFLIFGHYFADFGLQSDFIAKFKVPKSAPFWWHVLIAHCAMQALVVLLVTNNVWISLGEFAVHFSIDYFKCIQKLTFNQDQALHIVSKLIWWALM